MLELWWCDDLQDYDGVPEPTSGAVLLCDGLSEAALLGQVHARCQVAWMDYGRGVPHVTDERGNVVDLEALADRRLVLDGADLAVLEEAT